MTLPRSDIAEIQRFCEDRTPPDLRDQMRLEAEVQGEAVTIADCRPPWDGEAGEWTRTEFAQLRYDQATRCWTLYWADSDDRWHRYDDLEPTKEVNSVPRRDRRGSNLDLLRLTARSRIRR